MDNSGYWKTGLWKLEKLENMCLNDVVLCAPLAQSVEQLPFKETVGGPIPSRGTKNKGAERDNVRRLLFIVP